MKQIIKLKVRPEASIGEKAEDIESYFIMACKNLDAGIFEPMVKENQYFENMDKYRFLNSMKKLFDYLKGLGITKVELVMETCRFCSRGENVHTFYVEPNVGKPAFAFNIRKEQGEIKDIFRCNYTDGHEREAKKNRDPNLTWIDYD